MKRKHWEFARKPNTGAMHWRRKDGVIAWRISGSSRIRVHRPNAIGAGFEDLVGPKGTARVFQLERNAMAAADREWPIQYKEGLDMAKITCATCEHSREYLDSMKRVLVCARFKMAPVEHNDNCGEWFAAIPRSNTRV